MKKGKRTPKGYNESGVTNKNLSSLLEDWMAKTRGSLRNRPDLILLSWVEIIGEKLAPMTCAESFINGVLTVRVKNSSLYSLLVQHEKSKLLRTLRGKFPAVEIRNIVFRLG